MLGVKDKQMRSDLTQHRTGIPEDENHTNGTFKYLLSNSRYMCASRYKFKTLSGNKRRLQLSFQVIGHSIS